MLLYTQSYNTISNLQYLINSELKGSFLLSIQNALMLQHKGEKHMQQTKSKSYARYLR